MASFVYSLNLILRDIPGPGVFAISTLLSKLAVAVKGIESTFSLKSERVGTLGRSKFMGLVAKKSAL